MNPSHQHTSLIMAARHSPACRRAALWQIAKAANGDTIWTPDGSAQWIKLCMAWVTFSYQPAEQWAFEGGDYSNDFKLIIIPDAVSRAPFVLPDLGEDSFIVRRYPRFTGDPTPELTRPKKRIGGASSGIQQQFTAAEAVLSDVAPYVLDDPSFSTPWGVPD